MTKRTKMANRAKRWSAWATILVAGVVAAGCGGEDRGGPDGAVPAADGADTSGLATAEFAVRGMTCSGCAIATRLSLQKVDGVASAEAKLEGPNGGGWASVAYDPTVVAVDELAEAIRRAGFEPELRGSTADG